MIREVTMVASDAILKGKSMDHAHDLKIKEALLAAKIDRNKRVERYAWAVLIIALVLALVGRESVIREIASAWGYIGSACLGALIVFLTRGKE